MMGPFRPLPLAIALIAVVTAIKVTGLVQTMHLAPPARANAHPAAPARAQTPPPSPASPEQRAPTPPAPPVEPPVSEAERALLQDLRARRVQLDARAQALNQREAMIAAAEQKLTERVGQLSVLQARLEQLDNTRRERDDANWRGLVKTYEAMRPRDAAAILNDLEAPVLMQVLDRMKEVKAAPILAAMQPERARSATAQLAQWRTRANTSPNLNAAAPTTPGVRD